MSKETNALKGWIQNFFWEFPFFESEWEWHSPLKYSDQGFAKGNKKVAVKVQFLHIFATILKRICMEVQVFTQIILYLEI